MSNKNLLYVHNEVYPKVKIALFMDLATKDILITHAQSEFFQYFGFPSEQTTLPINLQKIYANTGAYQTIVTSMIDYQSIHNSTYLAKHNGELLTCQVSLVTLSGDKMNSIISSSSALMSFDSSNGILSRSLGFNPQDNESTRWAIMTIVLFPKPKLSVKLKLIPYFNEFEILIQHAQDEFFLLFDISLETMKLPLPMHMVCDLNTLNIIKEMIETPNYNSEHVILYKSAGQPIPCLITVCTLTGDTQETLGDSTLTTTSHLISSTSTDSHTHSNEEIVKEEINAIITIHPILDNIDNHENQLIVSDTSLFTHTTTSTNSL